MLNGLFSGKPECFTIKSPYLFQRLAEYNFPTENGDVTYSQLKDMLIKIFRHETHSFKLNLSFGLILQNVQDLSYRYYYPLQQDPMLDSPVLISTIQDIESLMDRLVQMDLLDSILKGRRPDTKSKLRQIANVVFYVYRTNYVLGQGHDLPAFITNSKSIIALVKNRHTGRNYDDEKCFFRALAISKGYNIDALERPTNQLVYQWMQYKNHTHFMAVSLKDIAELEECFKTNINIYELLSPEVAKTVYVSISKYPASLFLNLYKNHLSYIKTFSTYANKYKCRLCEKMFSRICTLKRHESSECTKSSRQVFKGGFYQPPKSVFEELEEYGISVPEAQKYFPFFVFFDFESVLDTSRATKQGENTEIISHHSPISFAVSSNVCSIDCSHPLEGNCAHCQKFRSVDCFVDSDSKSLVKKFVEKLREYQAVSQTYMMHQFRDVLSLLEEKIEATEKRVKVINVIPSFLKSQIKYNCSKYLLIVGAFI